MSFEIKIKTKNIDNLSYNLDYSLTRGMNWASIEKNITSKEYSWSVPSIKGYKNILIKASLNDDEDINESKKLPVLEQSINISVLDPNGGEIYQIGDKMKIKWSIKKIYDKTIDIFYSLNGGKTWDVVYLGAQNSGRYNWIINDNILSSNNCKIKIQSNKDKKIFDITDGSFTIKGLETAFTIITPNDGDIVYKGTSTFIYWKSLDSKISKVDIYYSLDKGKSWNLINSNLLNNGKYNWAVPRDIKRSNKSLIKIVASNNDRQIDFSDNTFIIK